MKLIHHVKKHWKTITLHLKKHHKKYIFGILSATLLWKWVSLIAAYALVHNLSFSFADTVHQWDTSDDWTVIETTITNNKLEKLAQDDWEWDEWDIREWDEWDIREWDEWNNWEWDEWNNWEWEAESNWICDRWDIKITSPMWGSIFWGTFDISREFKNDDCSDTEYTIKLRTESGQLEIFSWNSENTWFSFNSTLLEPDYYTWYSLTIYGNNTLYREEEGGDFTIDNKSPTLSDITISFSTRNNKLNMVDTATLSFESDEELTGINVNIQWQSAYLQEKEWNKYTYTMEFSDRNTTWKVVYWIDYSDIAWNTGYAEWYDNIELDYTSPTIENLSMTSVSWSHDIKITFKTDEVTNAHLVYLISWTIYTNSLDSNNKTGHEFTLQDIKNKHKYNYSIEIEDEAKNTLNIGWDFYLSWNGIIFTSEEISKSHLITEAWFKTWDEIDLKEKFNSFDKCTQNLEFINMNLPINGMTWKLIMPNYTDSSINQMTNAFTTILVKRIDGKAFRQSELDEIFEDLNNFLIIVKLVKDDENACKQNMSQYYINRFKKTLIKYKLINN